MIAINNHLLERWHRLIGCHRFHRRVGRDFGALGYLTHGPKDDFVEIEKLILVLLYDETFSEGKILNPTRVRTLLAGFGASRIPWGVQWGGDENSHFLKDLTIRPKLCGCGLCVDLENTKLLELGLRLDRLTRFCTPTQHRTLRLPRLWAGFRPKHALFMQGDGPELEAAAQRARISPQKMMRRNARTFFGLNLFPMDWTQQHLDLAVAILADLRRFPAFQAFSLPDLPGELCGYRGATQFDFYDSRFRTTIGEATAQHE